MPGKKASHSEGLSAGCDNRRTLTAPVAYTILDGVFQILSFETLRESLRKKAGSLTP
jgi:hypothetical protein